MRTLTRRKSKKQRAMRAMTKAAKKATKARLAYSVVTRAPGAARKAAKAGMMATLIAKARRPLLALGAVAGGAVLAKRLTAHDDLQGASGGGQTYVASTPVTAA
jgi:hypothetical protein